MSKALGWTLVTIQFALIALLVLLPRGAWYPLGDVVLVAGGVIVASGLAVGALGALRLGSSLTPSPIPRQGASLRTEGIYALVRHPIYSGLLLVAVGLALWGASLWHALSLLALWIVISIKARVEERLLSETFEGYDSYAAKVGRFFPAIGRIDTPTRN